MAKVQSGAVAEHLRVERRLPVDEGDREAEHPRVELRGPNDVSHEELWFGGDELRLGAATCSGLRHGVTLPVRGSLCGMASRCVRIVATQTVRESLPSAPGCNMGSLFTRQESKVVAKLGVQRVG